MEQMDPPIVGYSSIFLVGYSSSPVGSGCWSWGRIDCWSWSRIEQPATNSCSTSATVDHKTQDAATPCDQGNATSAINATSNSYTTRVTSATSVTDSCKHASQQKKRTAQSNDMLHLPPALQDGFPMFPCVRAWALASCTHCPELECVLVCLSNNLMSG